MGVSMALAFKSRKGSAGTGTRKAMLLQVLRRTMTLLFLGFFHDGSTSIPALRYCGVLQYVAERVSKHQRPSHSMTLRPLPLLPRGRVGG